MKKKMKKLTEEQIAFVMHSVGKWIAIKEENNQSTNSPDATHSSLLQWLLKGNEPLPKPPPIVFSRPCHSLAIGDPLSLLDPPKSYPSQPGKVTITRNSQWEWVDSENGILRHITSDEMYHWDKNGKVLQKI